jgi:hypothetical protein
LCACYHQKPDSPLIQEVIQVMLLSHRKKKKMMVEKLMQKGVKSREELKYVQ